MNGTTYKVYYIGLDLEVEEAVTLHNLDGDYTMMNLVLSRMEVVGYPHVKILRYNKTFDSYENITREVFLINRDRIIKNLKTLKR